MTLEDIRNEIQDIDYQILGLMKRRLELARLVGEDKIARNAAVRNIPQEDRMVVLGHKSREVNDRYTHASDEALYKVFTLTSELFSKL